MIITQYYNKVDDEDYQTVDTYINIFVLLNNHVINLSGIMF